MTYETTSAKTWKTGEGVTCLGMLVMRYGLVLILVWIGLLKFTAYESAGIKPLVENSPFMSWGYSVMSVEGFAMLLGVIEILVGLMIATRPFLPKVSALGSLLAIGIFLSTLSFLFTTPPAWQGEMGFPYLSPMPGQFLLKDIVLLGISIWSLGEALKGGFKHA